MRTIPYVTDDTICVNTKYHSNPCKLVTYARGLWSPDAPSLSLLEVSLLDLFTKHPQNVIIKRNLILKDIFIFWKKLIVNLLCMLTYDSCQQLLLKWYRLLLIYQCQLLNFNWGSGF